MRLLSLRPPIFTQCAKKAKCVPVFNLSQNPQVTLPSMGVEKNFTRCVRATAAFLKIASPTWQCQFESRPGVSAIVCAANQRGCRLNYALASCGHKEQKHMCRWFNERIKHTDICRLVIFFVELSDSWQAGVTLGEHQENTFHSWRGVWFSECRIPSYSVESTADSMDRFGPKMKA